MKVNNIQRKYLLVVGIIILCGTALFAVSKADIFKQVAVSQKLINDVYKYIVTNYADEIDVEKFTRRSIRNIMNDLDPFTVFMEPEEGEGIEVPRGFEITLHQGKARTRHAAAGAFEVGDQAEGTGDDNQLFAGRT